MDRRTISKNGAECKVDHAADNSRPVSRARRTASKGIRTPETAYRVLLDGAADILNGSVTAGDMNGVGNAIVRAVVVARNADTLAAMGERAAAEDAECCDEEQLCGEACDFNAADPRDAKIVALERELAEIKAALRRPAPKKG